MNIRNPYFIVLVALATILFLHFYFHGEVLHHKISFENLFKRALKFNQSRLPDVRIKMVTEQLSTLPSDYGSLSRQSVRIVRELRRLIKNPTLKLEDVHSLHDLATLMLETRLDLMDKISGQSESRRHRLLNLSYRLHDQLQRLQNPPNCDTAQFITTTFPNYCGFGCHAHHMSYVLSVGLALNRTLFIVGDTWKDVFLPITPCPNPLLRHNLTNGQTISWGMSRDVKSRFNPPTLTPEWASALEGLHGNPFAWFRGQLLAFILRIKDEAIKWRLEAQISEMRCEMPSGLFACPVAGIHVRRTDKIQYKEAEFHNLSEYMPQVERFFQRKLMEYQLKTGSNMLPEWTKRKRVFLASDDPSVFEEARRSYLDYEFIGDNKRATSAYDHSVRATLGIYTDFRMLASTDFLSCTMSSNICRMAYEYMLADNRRNSDSTLQAESVDVMYFNVGERKRWWRALVDYRPWNISRNDRVSPIAKKEANFLKADRRQNGPTTDSYPSTFLFEEEVLRIPDHD
ncbi:unnamed protein product [Dibothriocephalus latus]|uniref:GT23 domain-containing protein n=1 Tax=Dibothriocephalus latus TaxID=60516 RepID=A0A3P7N9I4_DIBLA|nr:unnamed protein product [Dibothriocephalus latus]